MHRLAAIALLSVSLIPSACAKRGTSPGSGPVGTAGDFSSPATRSEAAFGGAGPVDAPSSDDAVAFESEEADHSRGLGTQYGEHHTSRSRDVRFERRPGIPDAVLSIRYDSVDNVRRFARNSMHFHSTGATTETADRQLRMSLLDDHGEVLPGGDTGEERFAVGRAGLRYRLGIENGTDERYEVVASVDGLDVIDGGEATLDHRGYVVDAFSSVVIDGWRTSGESVAAFRFSTVDDSYAGRTGRGRNVGVVGAAFFAEARPAFDRRQQRSKDRFAPPPPPRSRSQRWW